MGSETASEASLLSAKVSVPQHVVYRSFPAETVVLNLQTGTYHGLNPSAGHMLAALEQAADVRAAAAALTEIYAQPRATIEADLRRLCESLRARGLIEIDAGAPR